MSQYRGAHHARTEDIGTCRAGQARRQGADDAGRRIRPRGDRTHPRGQAWRAVDQAGGRNRAVESPPRRRQAAAAQEGNGVRKDAAGRRAQSSARSSGRAALQHRNLRSRNRRAPRPASGRPPSVRPPRRRPYARRDPPNGVPLQRRERAPARASGPVSELSRGRLSTGKSVVPAEAGTQWLSAHDTGFPPPIASGAGSPRE